MSGGSAEPGLTRVSNVSSMARARTRAAPISQILQRLAERPVVSRSKTTNSASSISDLGVRRVGQPDARAEPGEPRIPGDDVVEQRAGERSGRALEREQHVGGVVRSHRAPPSLHELDEPIRSIERELHVRRLSNICSYLKPCGERTTRRTTEGPPRGGPCETSEDALD